MWIGSIYRVHTIEIDCTHSYGWIVICEHHAGQSGGDRIGCMPQSVKPHKEGKGKKLINLDINLNDNGVKRLLAPDGSKQVSSHGVFDLLDKAGMYTQGMHGQEGDSSPQPPVSN